MSPAKYTVLGWTISAFMSLVIFGQVAAVKNWYNKKSNDNNTGLHFAINEITRLYVCCFTQSLAGKVQVLQSHNIPLLQSMENLAKTKIQDIIRRLYIYYSASIHSSIALDLDNFMV